MHGERRGERDIAGKSTITLTIVVFYKFLGVDSAFFSTLAFSDNRIRFFGVSGGFLERRIPGKNGEVCPLRDIWDVSKWGRYP